MMKDFLNIAVFGEWPYFLVKGNETKGSDILMIELLSKKLGFSYNLTIVDTPEQVVLKVLYAIYYTS